MEPTANQQNITPESAPQPVNPEVPAGGESRPENTLATPERGQNNPPQPGPIVTPAPTLPKVTPPSIKDHKIKEADNTDSPAIADDVDVIEMEWVNKAKDIIKKTKDDPHAQEREVEKLQRDYLKKRYGKDIKAQQ